jgi:hypothetical protein
MAEVDVLSEGDRFCREDTSPPDLETRSAARLSLRLPLVMCVFNQSAAFEGRSINSSPSGICAETRHPVIPGTSVWVRISAGRSGEEAGAPVPGIRMTGLGEVKWRRAVHGGVSPIYHVGIRYYYETLLKVTEAISMSKDPEDIVVTTVGAVKTALKAKGAALFLVKRNSREHELAAANGLSREYLGKGPLSAVKSIPESLEKGPVAVYDVSDDPRIQYPKEAAREGIASILSVPVAIHGRVMGILRVYTAEPWEFTIDDLNLVQAVAQIAGMAIDIARLSRGYKHSIEILKSMRDPRQKKSTRRTPYEGVPLSVR